MFIVLAIVLPVLFVTGLCCVGMLAAIAIPSFMGAQVRARVSHVRSEMRNMAACLEAFYVDNAYYPYPDPDGGYAGETSLFVLTTPTAYMPMLPHDSFQAQGTFRYHADSFGWIIWSPGPDSGFDLDPTVYRSDEQQPSDKLLLYTYDPTNGTVSDGDIWRIHE